MLMTLGDGVRPVLRFDQDAYWGLESVPRMAECTPIGTPWWFRAARRTDHCRCLLKTLSRFFAIHVFIIPGRACCLRGFAFAMVLNWE